MEVQAVKREREEYLECASLASDAAQIPYGPPGAARRHFCSEPTEEDVLNTLYPATSCRWGGHLGPTYLDSSHESSDDISIKSNITPAPAKGRDPVRTPYPAPTPQLLGQPFRWAPERQTQGGRPLERPYPFMMERDVERRRAPAGRDALAENSRYPSLLKSKKPLVN